jgi:hypothetical protein
MRAGDLREDAFAACEEGNATVCRAKLSEAKTLDLEGSRRPTS